MNPQFVAGPRGIRGGRGAHHQNSGQGRFQNHDRRFPNPPFTRNNHNSAASNNNNSTKCFNQNVEHCPNSDRSPFRQPAVDRHYPNAPSSALYGEPGAFPVSPLFHGGRPFYEQHFAAAPHFGLPPHLAATMQVVSYPPPPPYAMQPPPSQGVLCGVFNGPPLEPYDPTVDDGRHALKYDPFTSESCDYEQSSVSDTCYVECRQTDGAFEAKRECPECAGVLLRTAVEVNALKKEVAVLLKEVAALQMEVAASQKEVVALKAERVAAERPTERRAMLSADAAPFEARETRPAGGPAVAAIFGVGDGCRKWLPDPVEQGIEKTYKEIFELIEDKPGDPWADLKPQAPKPEATTPKPPSTEPVVVSAAAAPKWSEMMDSEIEAAPIITTPTDHTSRGRGRSSAVPDDGNKLAHAQESTPSRGPQGQRQHMGPRRDFRGSGPRGIDFRPTFTPSDRNISYQHGRGAAGVYNRNRGGGGGYNNRSSQHNRPDQSRDVRQSENWRAEKSVETKPQQPENDADAVPQPEEKDWDAKDDPSGEPLERSVEKLDAALGSGESAKGREGRPSFDRDGSRQRGGSGDGNHAGAGGYARADAQPGAHFITEMDGDLFTAPGTWSLAHCVAEDMQMGSGIAVTFRDKFKQVGELLDQRKVTGEVATLPDSGRFIYYLVTKKFSQGKPSIQTVESSVHRMAEHCRANSVTQLAMPRIGCGLDRLSWTAVRRVVASAFAGAGVAITVYNYPQADELRDETTPRKRTLFFTPKPMRLVDIATGTGLIYLCAEDASETPTMTSLARRHNFLPELRASKRACGELVVSAKGGEVLYGMVVKRVAADAVSYAHLLACMKKLRSRNNKDAFEYMGVEAFRDKGDALTMAKIATVVRNVFGASKFKIDFWLCYPDELVADMEEFLLATAAVAGRTP